MKALYTQQEFFNAKVTDKLPLECYVCHCTFFKLKRVILSTLRGQTKSTNKYCCSKCAGVNRTNRVECKCTNCGKSLNRKKSHVKRHKNMFCSHACSASYNNNTSRKNKPRRSKLEYWLESKLNILYPDLQILYCNHNAINAELDIYIPTLSIAFEINGICHYEPIYGIDQLLKVQANDNRKYQACIEHAIKLITINASDLKYFKERNCQKYLQIIISIIENRIKHESHLRIKL